MSDENSEEIPPLDGEEDEGSAPGSEVQSILSGPPDDPPAATSELSVKLPVKSMVDVTQVEAVVEEELSPTPDNPSIDEPPPLVSLEEVPESNEASSLRSEKSFVEILPDTTIDLVPPPEPEPEPEPPRYVEPLGTATEESLNQGERQAWILDKLFHEGSMGRYATRPDDFTQKPEDGGSTKYEDYHWQLEKFYREVPADMSLGKVRLKPDELLYEGERFVLGKMYRDLREEDGYVPTAEKEESLLDLSDAVEVNVKVIEQVCPLPVYQTASSATMKCIQVDCDADDRACGASRGNNQSTGKVFEFTYSPVMSVAVDSTQDDCDGSIPPPITPQDCVCPAQQPNAENGNQRISATPPAPPPTETLAGNSTNTVSGRCRNNLPCDSNIEAVCQAARSAMAIYDTLTGCDNFPCNIGDRPEAELENIEDSVWSWLYQIILKLVPVVDANKNPVLSSIPEESSPPNADEA